MQFCCQTDDFGLLLGRLSYLSSRLLNVWLVIPSNYFANLSESLIIAGMNTTSPRTSPRSLYLMARTWSRDSHGLYDYETEHFAAAGFETQGEGRLYRTGDEVNYGVGEMAEGEELIRVEREEGDGFRISGKTEDEDLWLAVKYLKGQVLSKDVVVKLGRVRYQVREVVGGEDPQESGSDTASSEDEVDIIDVPGEHDETCCRICYDRETDEENPLLSFCRCDGSVKYTHLLCLKQWLRSKVGIRPNDSCTTYSWKSLECEICKMELPLSLRTRGQLFTLFDFEKPQCPYVILEALCSERSSAKYVHVISTAAKSCIRLGRGHDSDMRINDISVSRCHAVIRFEGGVFRLEDNSSKFGTLVKVAGPLTVSERVVLQTGRSLLLVEPRDKSKSLRGEWRAVAPSELDPSITL